MPELLAVCISLNCISICVNWTRSIRVDFCLFTRFLLLAATNHHSVQYTCLFWFRHEHRTTGCLYPNASARTIYFINRWMAEGDYTATHTSASDKNIDLWFFLFSRPLFARRIKIMVRFTCNASSAYYSIEFSFSVSFKFQSTMELSSATTMEIHLFPLRKLVQVN